MELTDIDSFIYFNDYINDLYSKRKHGRFIEQLAIRINGYDHSYWLEIDKNIDKSDYEIEHFGGNCIREGVSIKIETIGNTK